MKFEPDEPESPMGGYQADADLFGLPIAGLLDGGTATGAIVILRMKYDHHEGDTRALSFRITPHVAGWEAEAMLREALSWIREERWDNEGELGSDD